MNGRVIAKRFVGTILVLLALLMLGADGELPTRAVAFAVFAVPGALLFRRTAKDAEWKRRYDAGELAGQAIVDGLADSIADRALGQPDPQGRVKRLLVGAAVLDAVTMPFRVVLDLARKQK